jgi:glutamyl-tRNAGlu reductase-like protein
MLDELLIINVPPSADAPIASESLEWRTCLRRVLFLRRSESGIKADLKGEFYYGREAYQFLLEVICGLHSPLLGETAVMGQFRQFRAKATFETTAWGRFLRRLTTDLLVDARHIRHHHLQGLGSQSYGSLIRKYVKRDAPIAVIGSGSLAREILPWLNDVRLFYRSEHHAKEIQNEDPQTRVAPFKLADAGWNQAIASLVIAAPLTAQELNDWLNIQSVAFEPILDLRATSANDPLNHPSINLHQLLASLNEQTFKLNALRSRLHHVAAARSHRQTHSPRNHFQLAILAHA